MIVNVMLPSPHVDVVSELYTEHRSWLYIWLLKKIDCHFYAEEIMQDTFVRILKKPSQADMTIRYPKAYLATIAKGLLMDHWRRKEVEQLYLEAMSWQDEAVSLSEEALAEVLESLLMIDHALDSLPKKVKHAFLRKQLEGVKYKEIALELGVSERMTKKYVARAMMTCILAMDAAE